ncbi:MAG TPA: HD domain-containing phosphohydrolase [Gallionellaceae bacterium]
MSSLKLNVDLRQMIIAIESAVSLVGMNDTNHGKRVGYIASQLGQQMGFGEQNLQFAFELGLLHDCGVSTEQMHSSLVNHFDWHDAHIHCEIGYRLLRDFEPLSKFATPILHHHTHWDQLGKSGVGAQDARMANLIFIADRIDVLSASHYDRDILLVRDEVLKSISQHAGSYFDPEFVQAFRELDGSEAFWISLVDRHITRYTWDMGQIGSSMLLTLPQLRQLSLIMSYIVDQKSPFTAQHSVRVADLAKYLAAACGLSDEQCEKIEIAGMLHDLGKLHMPDSILDKPGPLDAVERSIMDQHSYETYEILRHIKGLEELALLAAYHHEGVNGGGYPFHPGARQLSVEARIIAVADVFQALVQNRPYRRGMELGQVLAILDDMVIQGRLDRDIVRRAKTLGAECFAICKGTDPVHNQSYINLFGGDENF